MHTRFPTHGYQSKKTLHTGESRIQTFQRKVPPRLRVEKIIIYIYTYIESYIITNDHRLMLLCSSFPSQGSYGGRNVTDNNWPEVEVQLFF